MADSITVKSAKTEDLDTPTRDAIVRLCVAAHQEDDFQNLFAYIPSGGMHFLAFREELLVSHALVTTRWLQPDDRAVLKTAYVDAVATLPELQGLGFGSKVMRRLASEVDAEFVIACLQTDEVAFYEQVGWQLWPGPLGGRSEQG
ncbi:MAG: GNAT family N-acetyltransferase, partial [Acidimicrobiia bacterium]